MRMYTCYASLYPRTPLYGDKHDIVCSSKVTINLLFSLLYYSKAAKKKNIIIHINVLTCTVSWDKAVAQYRYSNLGSIIFLWYIYMQYQYTLGNMYIATFSAKLTSKQ